MYRSPLVSVVITIYQGVNDEHLLAALTSIKAQSHRALETLIVVDGPIDERKNSILEEFAKAELCRIIRLPENVGPGAARNAGIKAAQGKYIAICDADDVNHADRFAIQIAYLEQGGFDVISSSMYVVDSQGQIVGVRELPTDAAAVRRLAPYSCPLNNPAVFGRARVLKAALYDEKYRVSEDYDLWIRLLLRGFRLGNTSERTVYYRQLEADYYKRRGVKYAIADLRVKVNAARLVPIYVRPHVWLVGSLAAAARLLPHGLFALAYRLKSTGYAHFFRHRSE